MSEIEMWIQIPDGQVRGDNGKEKALCENMRKKMVTLYSKGTWNNINSYLIHMWKSMSHISHSVNRLSNQV